MKKFLLLFFISLFSFGVFNIADAQFNAIGPTPVSVETVPAIPGPNEKVMASVQSYGTDLDQATISWYLNGKKELSGKGEKFFYFNTGNSNTTTSLEVVIVTSIGETIRKTFQIKPTTVDIIWQSESYVPPFYKGKALFSWQNRITFVAIPHITNSNGVELNPKTLTYKWTRNGSVMTNFSGYGKNTYTYIPSIISRPLQIEVEVTSTGDDVAYSQINLAPIDPIIMFYEKSPLYGFLYEKSLGGKVSLKNQKEIEIAVVPFFFGTNSINDPNLPYIWKINGSQIDSDTTKTSRFFRPKEGTSGISNISLSIDNADEVLQSASSNFNLEFDTTNITSDTTF